MLAKVLGEERAVLEPKEENNKMRNCITCGKSISDSYTYCYECYSSYFDSDNYLVDNSQTVREINRQLFLELEKENRIVEKDTDVFVTVFKKLYSLQVDQEFLQIKKKFDKYSEKESELESARLFISGSKKELHTLKTEPLPVHIQFNDIKEAERREHMKELEKKIPIKEAMLPDMAKETEILKQNALNTINEFLQIKEIPTITYIETFGTMLNYFEKLKQGSYSEFVCKIGGKEIDLRRIIKPVAQKTIFSKESNITSLRNLEIGQEYTIEVNIDHKIFKSSSSYAIFEAYDDTDSMQIFLFGYNVAKIVPGKKYRIEDCIIKEFNSMKQIQFTSKTKTFEL